MGNVKRFASGIRKRRGHVFHAKTVGVGFDHGAAVAAGSELAFEKPPVFTKGGEIDGKNATGALR